MEKTEKIETTLTEEEFNELVERKLLKLLAVMNDGRKVQLPGNKEVEHDAIRQS